MSTYTNTCTYTHTLYTNTHTHTYTLYTICVSDLVEQVDLGDHISRVPGVAYQHDDQFDKGIHRVVALSSSHCCIGGLRRQNLDVYSAVQGLQEHVWVKVVNAKSNPFFSIT